MRSPLGFLSGGITGHYRAVFRSGLLTTVAANGPVFSAIMAGTGANQWIRALIQRLKITASVVTPFTTLQELSFSAFRASSFTLADTGGSSATFTPPTAMLNDIADNTPILAVNIAGTGVLTAGTRTLDTLPFLVAQATTPASPGTVQAVSEYLLYSDQQYPLNINGAAANYQGIGNAFGPEGIVIQNNVLMGAAGTVRMNVEIDWVEYDSEAAPGGEMA